jgi:hypothetical protein
LVSDREALGLAARVVGPAIRTNSDAFGAKPMTTREIICSASVGAFFGCCALGGWIFGGLFF